MQNRWQPAKFGALFTRVLEASGISQAQVAAKAGVNKGQLSRWKRGEHRPDYDGLAAVGDVLQDLVPAEKDLTARLLQLAGYDRHFGAFRDALIPPAEPARRGNGR